METTTSIIRKRIHKQIPISELLQRPLLKPTDVCRILGVSRSKFEVWKSEGQFRFEKLDGMIFVPRSELHRLFPNDFKQSL
jgi:hypothetical protein